MRKRRFSLRRWFQFRLRSLMLLMVVAAIILAVNRPDPPGGRPLPDGWTIYEQTKELPTTGANRTTSGGGVQQRSGRFAVVDTKRRKRVVGAFADGEATGRWRIFQPNGRKALEGTAQEGVPVGKWSAWHPNGRLAAEVTFREPEVRDSQRKGRQLKTPMAVARRDGPAHFHDERGNALAAGNYRDDRREGLWTMNPDGVGSRRETYLAGLRHEIPGSWFLGHQVADSASLLESLRRDLASGRGQQQVAAAEMLQHCGAEGIEVLRQNLSSASKRRTLLVCEVLGKIGPEATAAIDDLAALAPLADRDLATAASLALVRITKDKTPPVRRLLGLAAQGSRQRQFTTIGQMSQLPADAVPVVAQFLGDNDPQLRRTAMQTLVVILIAGENSEGLQRLQRSSAVLQVLEQATQNPHETIAAAARDILRMYDDGELDRFIERRGPSMVPFATGVGCPF